MKENKRTSPLAFNVQVLSWLNFWPKDSETIKPTYVLRNLMYNFPTYISGCTVITASLRQLAVGIDDASALIESSIGACFFLGYAYINACFFLNFGNIKRAVKGVDGFRKYCPDWIIEQVDFKARRYTKVMLAYGLSGNVVNVTLGLYASLTCERPSELLRARDPCGMPCRCFFPMDVSGFPLYWIILSFQVIACAFISLGLIAVTMLQIGILMHATAQLEYCAEMIRERIGKAETPENVIGMIVKYHIEIIEYSETTRVGFASMMMLHLTTTSLIISVLGFRIVAVDDVAEIFRFGLQLLGWLVPLFFVCFYGQQLTNESIKIAEAAYSIDWFDYPISIQKDVRFIIQRAQKPLILTALNLGTMSNEMFLSVIKTAYSYFAMFRNLKS